VTNQTGNRGKQVDDFEGFFRRAHTVTFNISCLEGILKPLYAGDWEFVESLLGDQMVVPGNATLDAANDFSWQVIHGILMLKPLAAEFYLKALLKSEGKSVDPIHNLLELHDQLGYTIKQRLDRAFVKMYEAAAHSDIPHIRLNNFRAVMDAHKGDFINMRYYGGSREQLDKIQDGMSNINAAIEALQIECLRRPEGKPWRDGNAMLLSQQQ